MVLFGVNTLASQLAARPLFRSGVDLVHFGVSVVGSSVRPISRLLAGDSVAV